MIYGYTSSSGDNILGLYSYKPTASSTDEISLDIHYPKSGDSYATFNGGYIQAKRLIATATTDAEMASANKVALITGDPNGAHMEFDNNEIMAKSNGTTATTLYLQSGDGDVEIATKGTVTLGCLLLPNDSYTNFGTGDPSTSLDEHTEGRVYFKIIN